MVAWYVRAPSSHLLCMQETEIKVNLDHNLLSFPGYNIETERNSISSRVAMFISTEVKYIRRVDLEGDDSNLMVIDLVGDNKFKIINVYISFSPQNNIPKRTKFLYQLELISKAMSNGTILLGDFNLDYSKHFDNDYNFKNFFYKFGFPLVRRHLF